MFTEFAAIAGKFMKKTDTVQIDFSEGVVSAQNKDYTVYQKFDEIPGVPLCGVSVDNFCGFFESEIAAPVFQVEGENLVVYSSGMKHGSLPLSKSFTKLHVPEGLTYIPVSKQFQKAMKLLEISSAEPGSALIGLFPNNNSYLFSNNNRIGKLAYFESSVVTQTMLVSKDFIRKVKGFVPQYLFYGDSIFGMSIDLVLVWEHNNHQLSQVEHDLSLLFGRFIDGSSFTFERDDLVVALESLKAAIGDESEMISFTSVGTTKAGVAWRLKADSPLGTSAQRLVEATGPVETFNLTLHRKDFLSIVKKMKGKVTITIDPKCIIRGIYINDAVGMNVSVLAAERK